MMKKARVLVIGVVVVVGVLFGPPLAGASGAPASGSGAFAEPQTAAEIQPSADATALAHALATDPAAILGASFVARPPSGTPTAVSTTPLAGFPRDGDSYAILTTGNALFADQPNNSGGTGQNIGGGNVRGNTDYDVTILKVDFRVPEGANCLTGLDFRFLSDEYPEYVGSSFNDAFIAELDRSTWTTEGSTIIAPDNFAFDPEGNVISINAAGVTSMSAGEAAGTTYDGATPLLTARVPVTPGDHSLYLSIFDQGDHILDSAVFVDALRIGQVADVETQCRPGATVLGPSLSPAEGDEGAWIPLVVDNGGADDESTTVTWSAVPGPGVDPGATCRFSDSPAEFPEDNFRSDLHARLADAFPQPPSEADSLETFMRCTDDGVFVVTATVSNGEGPPQTASAEVTVRNLVPLVVIEAPRTGTRVPLGQAVEVQVLISDPGANDTHTCRIDWGDGTSSDGSLLQAGGTAICSASHRYTALGRYVITAHVRDDDTPSAPSSVASALAMSVAPGAPSDVPPTLPDAPAPVDTIPATVEVQGPVTTGPPAPQDGSDGAGWSEPEKSPAAQPEPVSPESPEGSEPVQDDPRATRHDRYRSVRTAR